MNRIFILICVAMLLAASAFGQTKPASDKTSQDTKKQSDGQSGDKGQQAMMKFLEAQRLAQDGDPKAIDLFKEVIALDPKDPQPHVELGKIYFQNRNFQEAEREGKESLKVDKDNVDAHRLLGNIYFADAAVGNDKVKSEGAIKEFEAITKIKNTDDDAWAKLSELYMQLEQKDKAIDALKHFTNINSENPVGFLQLAQLYLEDNKYDDAATAARKAYDLVDPSQRPRIVPLLAEALRRSGKTAEAAELLRKNMSGDKGSTAQAKLTYAQALLSAGKNDEAVKPLDEVLHADPKNVQAIDLKAEAERRAGHRARSSQDAQRSFARPGCQREFAACFQARRNSGGDGAIAGRRQNL